MGNLSLKREAPVVIVKEIGGWLFLYPEVNFNSEVCDILWTNGFVTKKQKIVKIRDNFLA